MIWAVVLAAGESRRMGRQKLLLPFGETTIVGAVVRTAEASKAERTMVVLGADREAIRLELEPLARTKQRSAPCTPRALEFTVNDNFRLGMLTSIQAGLRALPAGAGAAVIMLGDQPFLPSRVIDAVIEAYAGLRPAPGSAHDQPRPGIIIPTFQSRRGHPVLIDLKYRDEVLGLDPSAGLRALMQAHAGDILEVEVADANILRDLDTPEDYAGLPEGVKPSARSGS